MTIRSGDENQIAESGKLNELRKTLTGLDSKDLERLQQLLHDPHEFANEISELLPHSITSLLQRKVIKINDLEPFIEDALQQSIVKNPNNLADILFPIMGPAIRKAVAEDIKKMIASLNETLEAGFSIRRIKWRLQALFSQRSFAEIVLANSYIYQVKQVFLIHRQTGILLHQEINAGSVFQEADMVSSMLTAIRDFVNDSLQSDESHNLDEIKAGSINILIEQGPHAVIAALVEGLPPRDIKLKLTESIEAVHFNFPIELTQFDGNTAPFENSSRFLKNCLLEQKKETKKNKPCFLVVTSVLLLLALSVYLFYSVEKKIRWNSLEEQIINQSGYVIQKITKKNGMFLLSGLKDPMAEPLDSLIGAFGFNPDKFVNDLKPFISLEDTFVHQRARSFLQLDYKTKTTLVEGILTIYTDTSYSFPSLNIINTLTLYGVTRIKIDTSKHTSLPPLPDPNQIIDSIEQIVFIFPFNEIILDSTQQTQFNKLVAAVENLEHYNMQYSKKYSINIISVTSKKGNLEANILVADNRMNTFLQIMILAGIKPELLQSKLVYFEDINGRLPLRSIGFNVIEKNLHQ